MQKKVMSITLCQVNFKNKYMAGTCIEICHKFLARLVEDCTNIAKVPILFKKKIDILLNIKQYIKSLLFIYRTYLVLKRVIKLRLSGFYLKPKDHI